MSRATTAVVAKITVFKRDWARFKGGDYTVTFGLNGGDDKDVTFTFSPGVYGGGDEANVRDVNGTGVSAGVGGFYRTYYASATLPCEPQIKAKSAYYLKGGDWEDSGFKTNSSPSLDIAWNPDFWDQDNLKGATSMGGVLSAPFSLTRVFSAVCEVLDYAGADYQAAGSPVDNNGEPIGVSYDPKKYECREKCDEEPPPPPDEDDFGYNKPFIPPRPNPWPINPNNPKPGPGPVIPKPKKKNSVKPLAGPEKPGDPVPCPDGQARNADGSCPPAVCPDGIIPSTRNAQGECPSGGTVVTNWPQWPKNGTCRQVCITTSDGSQRCYVVEFVGVDDGNGNFSGPGGMDANECPGCYNMVTNDSGGADPTTVQEAQAQGKCSPDPDPCEGKYGDPNFPDCIPGKGILAGGTCADPNMALSPQCRGGGSNVKICNTFQVEVTKDDGTTEWVEVETNEGDNEQCIQGPVNPGSGFFCEIVFPPVFSRSCTEFGQEWEDAWLINFTYVGPGRLFDYADVPRRAGANEVLPQGWKRLYWEGQDTGVIYPPTFTYDPAVNGVPVSRNPGSGNTTPALPHCLGQCMHYGESEGVWQLIDYLKCPVDPHWMLNSKNPGHDPFKTVARVNDFKAKEGSLGEGWHSGEDFLTPSEPSLLTAGYFTPNGFNWLYSNWKATAEPGLWPAIDTTVAWEMSTQGGNVQIPEVTIRATLVGGDKVEIAKGVVTSAWAHSDSSPETVPVYEKDGWSFVENKWVYDAADDGRVTGEGMGNPTGQTRSAVFKWKAMSLNFQIPRRRKGVADQTYQLLPWTGYAQGTKACRKRASFDGTDPAYDACILEASSTSLEPADEGYYALFEEANRDYFASQKYKKVYYPEFVPVYNNTGSFLYYKVEERIGYVVRFSSNVYPFKTGESQVNFPGFPVTGNEFYMKVPFGRIEIDVNGDGIEDMGYNTWSYEDGASPYSWSFQRGWVHATFGQTTDKDPGGITSFDGCDVLDSEDPASAALATHVRIKLLDDDIPGHNISDTLRVPISKIVPISYVGVDYPCTTTDPIIEQPGGGGIGDPDPWTDPEEPPPLPPTSPPPPPFEIPYIGCAVDEICVTFQDGINTLSRVFKRQGPDDHAGQAMFPDQAVNGRDWYIEKANWPTDSAALLELIGTPQGPYYIQYDGTNWVLYRGTSGNAGYLAPITGTPPTDTDPCPTNATWPAGVTLTTDMAACEGTPPGPPQPPVVVEGCMDSSALNYVPWATVDNGTCRYDEYIKDPWGRDIKAVTIDGKVYEWIEQDCFRVGGATNTSPIIVTTTDENGTPKSMNLSNGDTVIIDDVRGNTAANGVWAIENVGLTTLKLIGSTGNGEYYPPEQVTDPSNPPEIHYLLRRCDLDMKVRLYVTGAPTGYDGIYVEGADHLGFKTWQSINDADKKFYYAANGVWTLARQGVKVAQEIWTSELFCNPSDGDWATGNNGMEVLALCGEEDMYVTNSNDPDANGTGIYAIQDNAGAWGDAVTVITNSDGTKYAFPNYKQTHYLDGTPHPDGAGGVNPYFMGVGTYHSDQLGEDPKHTHWWIGGTVNKFGVAGALRPYNETSIEFCPHSRDTTKWGNFYSVSKDAP